MKSVLESIAAVLGLGSRPAEGKVEIEEGGRCGAIRYTESAGHLTFSWEFGGRDIVAIISVGTEEAWLRRSPWTAGRRGEILRHVAREVIRQKAPNNRVEIDDAKGFIYVR